MVEDFIPLSISKMKYVAGVKSRCTLPSVAFALFRIVEGRSECDRQRFCYDGKSCKYNQLNQWWRGGRLPNKAATFLRSFASNKQKDELFPSLFWGPRKKWLNGS